MAASALLTSVTAPAVVMLGKALPVLAATPLVAQATLDGFAPVVVLLLGGLVVGGGFVLELQRRNRKREGLARLLAREPSLRTTDQPCGRTAAVLAGSPATPRGDRRFGVRYGVSGPLEATIVGAPAALECSAFQWWHEERRTSSSKHGSSTRYVCQTRMVGAATLPVHVPGDITIRPESVLGRVGITRGGHQFESSEFNRRFRVTGGRTLTLHLLGAELQHRLVEEFDGRTLHLTGDLLLLGGDPSHRDGSLPGAIGALPAIRQDVARLLASIPSAFWRALPPTTSEV